MRQLLTLDVAQRLVAAALDEAGRRGAQVSAAVVDAGGHLVAFARMDGAEIAGPTLAVDKAYTAVAQSTSTEELAALAAPGGPAVRTAGQRRWTLRRLRRWRADRGRWRDRRRPRRQRFDRPERRRVRRARGAALRRPGALTGRLHGTAPASRKAPDVPVHRRRASPRHLIDHDRPRRPLLRRGVRRDPARLPQRRGSRRAGRAARLRRLVRHHPGRARRDPRPHLRGVGGPRRGVRGGREPPGGQADQARP